MRIAVVLLAAGLCAACQGQQNPFEQAPGATEPIASQSTAPEDIAQTADAGEMTEAATPGSGVTAAQPAEPAPPATPAPVVSTAQTERPRHVELTGLQIEPNPTVDTNIPAVLTYAGGHVPDVKRVCFFWTGDGPYCWDYLTVEKSGNRVTTSLKLKEAKEQTLEAYVEYQTAGKLYKSNKVSTTVTAHP